METSYFDKQFFKHVCQLTDGIQFAFHNCKSKKLFYEI